MLEVTRLTRFYGDFKAVDEVNFKIDHGEIVGLLGHNGAGKTTIMKMLSGYLEPNNGSITIDNINLQIDPKKAQLEIGYLPENLPINVKKKLALFCNVQLNSVIEAMDADTIYDVPLLMKKEKLDERVMSKLKLSSKQNTDLENWKDFGKNQINLIHHKKNN